MGEKTKEDWLNGPVRDLPGLSKRVLRHLPWSYSSEITIKSFFNWCRQDMVISKRKMPRIHGIGIKGLQEIREALLKVGFTTKDNVFLKG